MDTFKETPAEGYESLYREFDSPLMRQLRCEAYGEDLGQHSWVSADELRGDIHRLKLSPSSRLLDLGCGPCGPLTFILATEVRKRSVQGYTQFAAAGWNEELLESAGFRLIETENRTMSVLKNAGGRLAAMQAHRAELEQVWRAADFERQRGYLETVVELSSRGAVSRVMYLTEAHTPGAA